MSNNPYKDYYNAMNSGDEFRYINAEKASKEIEELEEIASLNGVSVETVMSWQSNEMGG